MNPDRPAEVRPAEDLAELARRINAEHEAGEGASRKGLEHFRVAGEALLKAKKQCGHGNFGPWLKANVGFAHKTACQYMRLAREWGKFDPKSNLTAALRSLTEDVEEPGEPRETPYSKTFRAWLDRVAPQTWLIETEMGGIENMLAERDKWDWREVETSLIPDLESLRDRLDRYIKEMQHAAEEE